MPTPSAITLRDLAFEWPDGTVALANVNGTFPTGLIGRNGTGKSTLLEHLVNGTAPLPDRPHGRLLTERVGYLPQRLDGLDEDASAMENVRAVAPDTPQGTVRNQLARLLLRGAAADRPVRTPSGGERFRVSLARLLLAQPPAHLLVLDEPTNNLDIVSVEQLVEALDAYRGALLVVSHDAGFLDRIGVDTVIALDPDGRMRQRRDLSA
ncbi:ATP-binding cassette domain-containing protein [Streptomyces triticirhizae]|uniref:ATP-binding cassette domain-containing protein n=1 Tax=Streptomyces triticirhizae TaxID=2483353 RepID=UPI0018F32EF0|nr:ATP-binding cassette domain-containing protein [Streptomyces triticirhizae]